HHRQRHARIVNPALHLVHEAQEPCIRVVDGYVDDLRIEDVAQLLANEVVDRLLLELARDRLLHTVDQREFGVSLPRLLDAPRSIAYASSSSPVASVWTAMLSTCASKTSRILSPTIS